MNRTEITETRLNNMKGLFTSDMMSEVDFAFQFTDAHFASIEPIDVQAIYVSKEYVKKLVPGIKIDSEAKRGYLCKIFGTYLWMSTEKFESHFTPYVSRFERIRYEREMIDQHICRLGKIMSLIDKNSDNLFIHANKMLEDKAHMTTLANYYRGKLKIEN